MITIERIYTHTHQELLKDNSGWVIIYTQNLRDSMDCVYICTFIYLYVAIIRRSYQFQEWGHWKGMDRGKERGEIM